jgi:hypothetical protein
VGTDPVLRDGNPIDIDPFVSALEDWLRRSVDSGRPKSELDTELSYVLHQSLRLTRAEAADRGMWVWLAAGPGRAYVDWRWADDAGAVTEDRWRGQINKQAFARLWWGAELLRDGPTYSSDVFRDQDIANSLINRLFMRSRPMAVSVWPLLDDKYGDDPVPKNRQRAWISGVNLYAGARSLDALAFLHRDRADAYSAWVRSAASVAQHPRVGGPDDGPVPEASKAAARRFLEHVWAETEPKPSE